MSDIASNYRPEIDGLRALAVMAVLLFHLDMGVPGGFIGVDVFFVISGFLITGILLKSLRNGTFSLTGFWVRRIKRILPASFVMVVMTLLLGYFLLTPSAFDDLAGVAMAHALVIANVLLAKQGGYFSEAAESSPLLHTWSLAVEEQFYIVFPLLLFLLWRMLQRRSLMMAILGVALVSLVWSGYVLSIDQKSAFFLLPSRAWELLAGGVLAACDYRDLRRKHAEIVALLGLVMILVPMLVYRQSTAFPGAAALVPVLGTVMVIFANKNSLTVTGRLLAWKPVVFIGLISYSLYLWHWPLLVFVKHVIIHLTWVHKLSLLLISILLASFSWRFIETPFRRRKQTDRRGMVMVFGTTALAIAVMMMLPHWLKAKVVSPVGDDVSVLQEDVDWHGDVYVPPDISDHPVLKTHAMGAKGDDIDFILWGDSHAMAIAQTVHKVAQRHGASGEAIYTVAVQPVTGVFFQELTELEREDMLARNEAIVDRIIRRKIPNVILVGRWVACCIGFNEAEMVGCKPMFRLAPMVIDRVGDSPSNETSTAALKRQLAAMCARLDAAGIQVWIMRQVPETIHLDTAQRVLKFKRFPERNELSPFTVTRHQHEQRRAPVQTVFTNLAAKVLDPTDRFFAENGRLRIYDQRAYYRDDDHLTRAGADYYLTPTFEKIFSEITRSIDREE